MRLTVAGPSLPSETPWLGAMLQVLAVECWLSQRCAPRASVRRGRAAATEAEA